MYCKVIIFPKTSNQIQNQSKMILNQNHRSLLSSDFKSNQKITVLI